MTTAIAAVFAQAPLPTLLVIGLAILFGTIGARIFQKLHIPQVVGYIAIGLALGQSGLKFINKGVVDSLEPFSFFALGIIGFLIGGELHREIFKKYGRQFFAILFAEGTGAFLVVSILISGVSMLLGLGLAESVSLGIVLGAIASATAPAATTNVLWEHKARGVLTTAVFAIVALDDALALVLFSVAASIAGKFLHDGSGGIVEALGHAGYELFGATILGAVVGFGLNYVLRRIRDRDRSLAFIIGAMAVVIGGTTFLKVDRILAAMALGVTLANLAPRRSRETFQIVERFAPPIYVLFFVVAGARLHIQGMPGWMWVLVLPYLVGMGTGKMIGSYLGARWTNAAPVLRKYLGLCLFSQAGVAVGLSLVASIKFPNTIGPAIIAIIAGVAFIAEIIGPPCVKFAVKKAGEVGLNVTEEDLMLTYNVSDMVDRELPSFAESSTLTNILRTIAETDAMSYPVTDSDGKLTGIITIDELKKTFISEGLTDWLVAFDLMRPVPDTVTVHTPLSEAVTRMREQELEYLPVVAAEGDAHLEGMLELAAVNRSLSKEVLRRQQLADGPLGE
ncbi:MAG: cation:proton antiporter [Planctomycetota bacterium]|nr:cation:proton antiporter [Planctomycetota bacterium]